MLHLDVHLSQIIAKHGSTTYAFLFAIVFCETGLVITPFLPGIAPEFGCSKLNPHHLEHMNAMHAQCSRL